MILSLKLLISMFIITLDNATAGQGGFVNSAPYDNEKLSGEDTTCRLEGSAAGGGMDLLTAVSHEIGHILGYSHNGSDSRVVACQLENLKTKKTYNCLGIHR